MKVRKGSFTIEAACVMSLVLITVMGVLYLSFFVHNRSWLTAAAYEAALAGVIDMYKKTDRYMKPLLQKHRNLEMWDSLAQRICLTRSAMEKQ